MELRTKCMISCLLCINLALLPIVRVRANCSAPPETGPCLNRLTRWAYNPATRSCLPFTYGGCGGNGNKFISTSACLNTCRNGRFFATRMRRRDEWPFVGAAADFWAGQGRDRTGSATAE